MSNKLAIIGASDFQNPLILKAKELGFETHVFAWECGDIGERTADYFYPISITEVEQIADKCKSIGVDGICSIGTDLGNITVSKVANKLGLCANSLDCVDVSTNKHLMREAFFKNGDPSPKSCQITDVSEIEGLELAYPIIVKPVDRSGSRCITKLQTPEGLEDAVRSAIDVSFSKACVVEEFFVGVEYSVEFVSWRGKHHFLALTRKFTTGSPHFIETGHLQPAPVSDSLRTRIIQVVSHALDSLGVEYGASHSEILVNGSGDILIVEIGSRMGGDCIGSDLVELSTGFDFLGAVISAATGHEPDMSVREHSNHAMIRFIFDDNDLAMLRQAECDASVRVERSSVDADMEHEIVDSGSRYGYFILTSDSMVDLEKYLPNRGE